MLLPRFLNQFQNSRQWLVSKFQRDLTGILSRKGHAHNNNTTAIQPLLSCIPQFIVFLFLISCLLYYNQSMQSGTQYYKKIIRKDMINP